MTRYRTLSHTYLPFVLALILLSGNRPQIMHDASKELWNVHNIPIDL